MKKETAEKEQTSFAEEIPSAPIQRKIALFGGSFDPVTKAHEHLILELSKHFDKVVVLPCRLSPFKKDANLADADSRVKMLKKVFDEVSNVKISKWEVNRDQCSYSYLAAEHFAEKYVGDALFFVVGSDGISRLKEWKHLERLTSKATFYVVRRPDFPVTQKQIDALNASGIPAVFAPFKGEAGSSSESRVANAFGFLESVVPEKAAKYIVKHGLYNDYDYITKKYWEFGLKQERIEHTYRAVKAGIALAKTHRVNINDAVVALLLHDVGKYADKKLTEKLGIQVPDEVFALPEPIQHAPISAEIARQYFKVQNDDIVAAIETHTTGAPKMSPLQELVYLADSVEEGRDFPELDALRKKAFESLDEGMLAALKNTIDYVSQSEPVFPRTIEAYEFYLNYVKKTNKKESNVKKEETAEKKSAPAKEKAKKTAAAPVDAVNESEKGVSPIKAESLKLPKTEKTAKTVKAVKADKADKPVTEKPAKAEKTTAPKKSVGEKSVKADKTATETLEKTEKPKKAATKKSDTATILNDAVTKTAKKQKAVKEEPTPKETKRESPHSSPTALAERIAFLLDEKKGQDVVIVDLNGKTIIADYFVIASAMSTTAVKSLCDYVEEKLSKEDGIEPLRRDIDTKWAAIDYGSIILHVFHEEARNFYQLERLWDNGDNIRRMSENN